jgi:cellulose synthase/poly-beta-1,6-N-acetylglucosamine synthase-like glycosyltransferase
MLDEHSERRGDGPPAAGPGRIVRLATRPTDRGLVVALIPARNEAHQIEDAIRSLHEQTLPPDVILVLADNCTDGTAVIAREAGAHIYETVDNTHKKAGALNQALDLLLPELRADDSVLVMDADSMLAPGFVSEARRRLKDGVGGVGGVFTGRAGGGFVGMLQRNEYARYARATSRASRARCSCSRAQPRCSR